MWYESSLTKLFCETHPRNDYLDEVLIKVGSLNDLYNVNVFPNYRFSFARHIVDLDIDHRLEDKDETLVNEIAVVKFDGPKTRDLYSFATKCFSLHIEKEYPIYDSFVENMLWHCQKKYKFSDFRKKELKLYPTLNKVLSEFRMSLRISA